MKWRVTLRALHRDIGYLCVGLTLVYGLSGILVNHHADWDYNFAQDTRQRALGSPAALLGDESGAPPSELARARQDELVVALRAALDRDDTPRNVFWRGPNRLSLFFAPGERDMVDYDPTTGLAQVTARSPRPLLRELNYLHLNEGADSWTWLADLFAVSLIFLALSGAVIVKGRKGFAGRGALLMALGAAIPVLYLLLR